MDVIIPGTVSHSAKTKDSSWMYELDKRYERSGMTREAFDRKLQKDMDRFLRKQENRDKGGLFSMVWQSIINAVIK